MCQIWIFSELAIVKLVKDSLGLARQLSEIIYRVVLLRCTFTMEDLSEDALCNTVAIMNRSVVNDPHSLSEQHQLLIQLATILLLIRTNAPL